MYEQAVRYATNCGPLWWSYARFQGTVLARSAVLLRWVMDASVEKRSVWAHLDAIAAVAELWASAGWTDLADMWLALAYRMPLAELCTHLDTIVVELQQEGHGDEMAKVGPCAMTRSAPDRLNLVGVLVRDVLAPETDVAGANHVWGATQDDERARGPPQVAVRDPRAVAHPFGRARPLARGGRARLHGAAVCATLSS